MPKNPTLVAKLEKPVKRSEHKGSLLYAWSATPGEIDGIYKSPMSRQGRKKA